MNKYSPIEILKRGIINGVLFAGLWGSWAYYVNLSDGADIALKSAITQSSFTIINAFVYSVIMEYMYTLGKNIFTRFILASVFPNILVTVILVSLHQYRGTPEIFMTVSPPLAIVFILSLAYVFIVGPKQEKHDMERGL